MNDDTIALQCLERDRGRCFKCGTELTQTWPGYSCHHRQLRSGGGPDTLENRIMLCGSGTSPNCHGWVHGHPHVSRENGWIVSRYANPGDEPVLHWKHGLVYLTANGDIISPDGQPIGD